ncbi:MAG TPA: NUDIX hydrolase [Mobilitalea sp.]|nr:NUDIX hydrolase [Mobilitalea sp.]
MDQYKRLKRDLIKKGSIIDYYNDTIEVNGEKKVIFDFINHKGASAMIPVDQDGKILMVRQYRNAIDQYTLEIPAGGLNLGEDNKTCAIRECEEETGYKAGETHHLINVFTTVAFSNEKIGIFYTNELTKTGQNLDEDEFVTIERYSIDEICKMIYDGTIQDAKTVAGILAYKTKMGL